MDYNNQLKEVLDNLGVPVERMGYNGDEPTFITYQLIYSNYTNYANDTFYSEDFLYRVDIYSRTNYNDLLQRTKSALVAADFYDISVVGEFYENSSGYYHVAVNCSVHVERSCVNEA
jgi:hypothetical protein